MTIPCVGDFVRFGKPPYNVFRVNELWNGGKVIGTTTVHGVYTELPADQVELIPLHVGLTEWHEQKMQYLIGLKDITKGRTPGVCD
jgi:hypothetical protein